MAGYANYLIYIFMNINENITSKRNITEKVRGYTCKITNSLTANCTS